MFLKANNNYSSFTKFFFFPHYRRKCDLCTCTKYQGDGSDSYWLCDYHITEHTATHAGKPVKKLPDQETLTSKCKYCSVEYRECPVGHKVFLCVMRHAPQNPYCPIDPDDGKLHG